VVGRAPAALFRRKSELRDVSEHASLPFINRDRRPLRVSLPKCRWP
jgi:hypothetical protein